MILVNFLDYKKNLDPLLIFFDWSTESLRKNIHFYFILLYFLISFFFTISFMFLLFMSGKAIFSGITTYERIKNRNILKNEDSDEFLSYVSNNSKNNFSQQSTEIKFEETLLKKKK
jgi:hypothetical protein